MRTLLIESALIIFVTFLLHSTISGQIVPKNPSFEGDRADATMPVNWWSCERGTTPDILPDSWGVYNMPFDGQSYVGLITRADGSFEAIGQRLRTELKSEQCYEWSLVLAHSRVYAGYNQPIKVAIYISDDKCERQQLIYRSPKIESEEWEVYSFTFEPEQDSKYITIVADYGDEFIDGNVLIDQLGVISVCDRAMLDHFVSGSSRL